MSKSVNSVDQRLPANKLWTLGIQHVLVMYAGAIAVPLIIAKNLGLSEQETAMLISADLFCCGVATILQSLGVGKYIGIRMPVIMAVTFAAVPPMMAIGNNSELGIQGIFGATIAAGIISFFFVPLIGKLKGLFPHVVTGVVITSIGISIMGVGINWAAGGSEAIAKGTYGDLRYIGTAWAVLVFILLITRFAKGFISNISVLLGIIFGFIVAWQMGEISFAKVADASWFGIVTPFAFGMPKFEFWSILTMTIVCLIVFIESLGMFMALGDIVEQPVDEKALNRGLRVDAIGTVIGGVFNSFPHTSFSQNIGLVSLTGIRSRYVCVASGVILIMFSLMPKMSAFISSIPLFVLGGAGIVMFGMVLATGIKILSLVDYQNNRYNLYIVAISLGMGMIPIVAKDFFKYMPEYLSPLLHSGILIATLWAVGLNIYLNHFDTILEKLGFVLPKKPLKKTAE
ncbi:nucleobase:cation symporter-2 family protein [Aeromonas cavernicola]|uniref:Purine permease n=1 Tax=Aeromonas cavernicola TaxID=1006623 RepID=A0A2H9U581_9GAMM|nr:nucleobase:cation symporter-2 family protein [Aeromonas cavernicola]PJG59181.1 purine permease [Aeromonas cavernicola]